MSVVRSGFHKVGDMRVLVIRNTVRSARSVGGNWNEVLFPHRRPRGVCGSVRVYDLTFDALRSGLRRGTIAMM